jgi:hypothetical protein
MLNIDCATAEDVGYALYEEDLMRKAGSKLLLSLLILTGALSLTPKVASASHCPPYYCCDPDCFGIRRCWTVGSSCICQEYCEVF